MTVITAHNSPTLRLPPIKTIKTCSIEELEDALKYLRLLYNPEVRGTRRISHHQIFPAPKDIEPNICKQRHGKGGASEDRYFTEMSSDDLERSYAIRWLTAQISRTDFSNRLSLDLDEPQLEWEQLIDDAAALLAICAGTASAGTVFRTFVFPHGADPRVKVQVRDAPLDNHDYSSVGAQTWGGACLLSEMIVDAPGLFGLDGLSLGRPLRILELGAGTGLVTLTIANLLHGLWKDTLISDADIVATDFHPSVLKNLQYNISMNVASPNVQTHFLDWSQFPSSTPTPPFDTPFDIILGADIIYEMEHAQWIHDCLQFLLRLPDGSSRTPRFHLVIPLRRTHQIESHAVDFVFPSGTAYFPSKDDISDPVLGIVRKEMIACESGDNVRLRASNNDMVEYTHYTIAWINPVTTTTDNVVVSLRS